MGLQETYGEVIGGLANFLIIIVITIAIYNHLSEQRNIIVGGAASSTEAALMNAVLTIVLASFFVYAWNSLSKGEFP